MTNSKNLGTVQENNYSKGTMEDLENQLIGRIYDIDMQIEELKKEREIINILIFGRSSISVEGTNFKEANNGTATKEEFN